MDPLAFGVIVGLWLTSNVLCTDLRNAKEVIDSKR